MSLIEEVEKRFAVHSMRYTFAHGRFVMHVSDLQRRKIGFVALNSKVSIVQINGKMGPLGACTPVS